ncbi:MAG TPA: TonB-dependent receptor [Kofleriaceae bacterium]|nr:TonB-dependent receptor [Kofleriaceae bacterium]
MRSETSLSASPVMTEVISREQLEESGVRTVGEALALLPGLWIDRGIAGTTGITIQGLGPRYSLVLVNGARQIGRTDGYLDLDRFGTADIEQLEIVRGPSSAVYGADALGGVVNIITRKPRIGVALDVVTRIDGRLAADAGLRLALGRDGLSGAVTSEYRAGPAIRRGDPSAVATTLDSYADRQVAGRISDQRNGRWQLDGAADYLYRDLQGVDASQTGVVFDRRNLVETASAQAAAQYTTEQTALRVTGDLSLYYDQYRRDQRMSNEMDENQKTKENLIEGSSQVVREIGMHRVLAGAEVLRESLDSERLLAPGFRVRGAVYTQDEWRMGQDEPLLAVATVRLDYDAQFGIHATPRLAGRWQANSRLALRGNIGTGYRAPDFKELLLHFENPGVGYVVDGNLDLKPETSRNVQGGAEWQVMPWLSMSASGFYNDLHDLIDIVAEPDDGSGTLRFGYGNVGRARTVGVESSATVMHGRAGLDLGYALTRARDLDGEHPLAGVPQHRFTATAHWRDTTEGLDAFAEVVFTGHRPYYLSDDPRAATPSPRRLEIRARIAKRFRGRYGGFVGVDNLLNEGDASLNRIPPRTLHAGLEIHL